MDYKDRVQAEYEKILGFHKLTDEQAEDEGLKDGFYWMAEASVNGYKFNR